MPAYYNENEPFVVEWLKNLIVAGHIAPGDVDDRSIADVKPEDLRGYDQCHFFAGIGGWSRALRLAGWPDNEPIWTGSCPCQPFSIAGKGAGSTDARHLWPVWQKLIAKCAPPVVFGEQVASPLGRDWLASVRTEMEALGYEVGAADLCAASINAPHLRQRLWFVADTENANRRGTTGTSNNGWGTAKARGPSGTCFVAHTNGRHTSTERLQCSGEHGQQSENGGVSSLGYANREQQTTLGDVPKRSATQPAGSFWATADWLLCRDNKARPVEPGTFPLAHGIPSRVGLLRAYGNAIVPQVAQAFIEAYVAARNA